jgi:hypothetical protein
MPITTVSSIFENLNLPDNVIDSIMTCHGGIYGMIPREVWDEDCMPEFDVNKYDYNDIVVNRFRNQFEQIKDIIRGGNWCLYDDGDLCAHNCEIVWNHMTLQVHPNQVPDNLPEEIEIRMHEPTRWVIDINYRTRIFRKINAGDTGGLYNHHELSDSDYDSDF